MDNPATEIAVEVVLLLRGEGGEGGGGGGGGGGEGSVSPQNE